MKPDFENVSEKNYVKVLDEKAQRLKCSMMYYFKSKQSYENLIMFVMDV